MFETARQLIDECNRRNVGIYDIVLENEEKRFNRKREDIIKKMSDYIDIMEKSAKKNLKKESNFGSGIINGFAKKTYDYYKTGHTISGPSITKAMALSFSTFETNSSMGRIIATPTAGSCGILPASLILALEDFSSSREDLINACFTAVGIGQIIGMYATFAGAEGGCQAETGSARSMAAGALVQLKNGSVEEILNAASIALINVLGLVCDPIAGLVEYPCTFRNASGIVNAMISADLALANVWSIVPFDEVCQAMGAVGKSMSQDLRETGYGGLANTRTGNKIRDEYFGKHSIGDKNKTS